jgi:transcriptional regulator with XRE-family HTH domain
MKEADSDNEDIRREVDSLGQRLRTIRTDRKLSLNAVSEGCQVSASLLSQVERGLVVPSLNTLYALSSFYGISLFRFFANDEVEEPGQIVRRSERRKITFPGSTKSYELISPANATSMSVFELLVDRGRKKFEHGVAHAGDECVLVLSGCTRVDLGGTVHTLNEGDSIFYDAMVPHQFQGLGDEPAHLIVTITPAI